MRKIALALKLFRTDSDRIRSERALRALLYALTAINLDYLKQTPGVPALYNSGVRYQAEFGTETWQDIPTMLDNVTRGNPFADCEDLATWRAAELNRAGIRANPYIRFKRRGNFYKYHVLVRLPNGQLEDPSRVLGMGAE